MESGIQRSPDSPRAAFLVDTAPQFAELSRVAAVLQGSGWHITFVFDDAYRAMERHVRSARNLGYDVVVPRRGLPLIATARALLSRAKVVMRATKANMSAVKGLLPSRRGEDAAGQRGSSASAVRPKHFSVAVPRVLARFARRRFSQWRAEPSLTSLPGVSFGVATTTLGMFPTLMRYMLTIWLPYKVWQVRRSAFQASRRSRFDPVWGFKFVVGIFIPYWTKYLKVYLRQARITHLAPGSVQAPDIQPGLNEFAETTLHQSLADFEILRIRGRILDHQDVLIGCKSHLLVLAKDCAYYATGFWVEAARQLGIGTMLIPFDDADTRALAEHRAGHRDHVVASQYAKAVADRYPEWCLQWAGEDLLLLQPELVEARARLGLTPPNPWAYNSSRCDSVLVESEVKREKLLAEGAPGHQIVVTGTVFQDLLAVNVSNAATRRRDLLMRLGLKDDKLLVLGSVTPNKVAERSISLEFHTYRQLLEYWISVLTRGDRFNVILCLHPSVEPREVAFLERYGAHTVHQDTASLIPLCDVYVVDCSATSRWALASGKLVVDYDVYRYDLAFHSKLPGIIHVLDKSGFENTLDQLAAGELEPLRAEVLTNAEHHIFGRLDGAAAMRIEAACRAGLKPPRSPAVVVQCAAAPGS